MPRTDSISITLVDLDNIIKEVSSNSSQIPGGRISIIVEEDDITVRDMHGFRIGATIKKIKPDETAS